MNKHDKKRAKLLAQFERKLDKALSRTDKQDLDFLTLESVVTPNKNILNRQAHSMTERAGFKLRSISRVNNYNLQVIADMAEKVIKNA
jgi:hypothetical protein